MPRVDRSIAILTGMIFAAIYVIMLVGVVQTSRAPARSATMAHAAPSCNSDEPVCAAPYTAAGEQRSCLAAVRLLRLLNVLPHRSWSIGDVEQAVRRADN